MPVAMRIALAGLVGPLVGVYLGCTSNHAHEANQDDIVHVEIVAPEAPGGKQPAVDGNSDEACKNGCSLAKHGVPEFTRGDYERAIRAYAQEPHDAPSAALEKLLFYGNKTESFIARHGASSLPAEHAAFLQRELQRKHAIVAIRVVDESGRARVRYGPARVPLGQKEHLRVFHDYFHPLEFNGTVMRTGVNYLWSRY